MNESFSDIHIILERVKNDKLTPDEAEQEIAALYASDLGFAKIDMRRAERTGFPEVVFCAGKTDAQAEEIIMAMAHKKIPVLGTKAAPSLAARIRERLPDASYDEDARTLTVGSAVAPEDRKGLVVIAAAGTSDLGPAKEAFVTAIVAAAGMEGALAGVLAGLVRVPVIALPTSVGYGASFGGLSALLGMLTSCAPGISVVNIDNGFGAGYQANLINLNAFHRL